MKKEKKKVYSKANYQGATPEQVARAMLKYRPKPEQKNTHKTDPRVSRSD